MGLWLFVWELVLGYWYFGIHRFFDPLIAGPKRRGHGESGLRAIGKWIMILAMTGQVTGAGASPPIYKPAAPPAAGGRDNCPVEVDEMGIGGDTVGIVADRTRGSHALNVFTMLFKALIR